MNRKPREVIELEAELVRLNTLVRARRQQLERLQKCPNQDCACRAVWREVVAQKLSRQVGKIRRQVRNGRPAASKAKARPGPKPSRPVT